MALVGNAFIQPSSEDPGTGYPMYYWNQTDTGMSYIRAADDSGWNIVGDSSQSYMGNLSTLGGAMSGPITGSHGLAESAVNNYAVALYQNGLEVCSKYYFDSQVAILNAQIHSALSSTIASIPILDVSTQIVHNTGVWESPAVIDIGGPPSYQIDLPIYPLDSVEALEADCIWGAYWAEPKTSQYAWVPPGHVLTATYYHLTIKQIANRVYNLESFRSDGVALACKVIWYIIAVRSLN